MDGTLSELDGDRIVFGWIQFPPQKQSSRLAFSQSDLLEERLWNRTRTRIKAAVFNLFPLVHSLVHSLVRSLVHCVSKAGCSVNTVYSVYRLCF